MERKKAENQFRKIVQKYVQGTASEEELRFLEMYYAEFENKEDIINTLSAEDLKLMKERLKNGIASKVFEKERIGGKVVRIQNWNRWLRVAVVAGLIIASGTWIYLYQTRENRKSGSLVNVHTAKLQNDIPPGGNKAILTLADGSTIILDSAGNGAITRQGNMTVVKLNNGEIAYNPETGNPARAEQAPKPGTLTYNTITTPRGGQYQLTLSDGTKVWLNAESSLRYPTAFTGTERKVELTGEGYFEVAHDATKPFKVDVAGKEEVEVLGTHFNINAYSDEPEIKTTLLEGRVKVNVGNESKVMKPGEQAVFRNNDGSDIAIQNPDVDEAIAWKNGRFAFSEADIKTVMRQLARWYNFKIEFKGEIKDKFHVEMTRNTNLSNVFRILEGTGGVHFKIEQNKVLVMP